MDHLPWTRYDLPRPIVPCLYNDLKSEDLPTTYEEWLEFPEKQRWSLEDDPGPSTLASRCQLWLFFGVINVIRRKSDPSFDIANLVVQEEDSRSVVRTDSLDLAQNITAYYNSSLKEMSWRTRFKGYPGIRRACEPLENLVRVSFDWLIKWTSILSPSNNVIEATASSVFLVYWATAMMHDMLWQMLQQVQEASEADELLMKTVYRFFDQTSANVWDLRRAMTSGLIQRSAPHFLRTDAFKRHSIASVLSKSMYVRGLMLSVGRCPTVFRRKPLTLVEIWWLLHSPPSSAEEEALQSGIHWTCLGNVCMAGSTSKKTYRMRHSPSCDGTANCKYGGFRKTDLAHLVTDNAIPVVCSTLDSEGIHLRLLDSRSVSHFTAISHVWAGGLGNFRRNRLYRCQLRFLHSIVDAEKGLGATKYYWLDTLCIPTRDKKLRQAAIDNMACIYASARTVLVLDPVLQTKMALDKSKHQLATLINGSQWMARSWPLQEATLAVDLQFRFRDRTVRFAEVDYPYGPLFDSHLQGMWLRDVDRLDKVSTVFGPDEIYTVLAEQDRMILDSDRLDSVWDALAERSSTYMGDVAAIMAVLLNRSAGEILELPALEQAPALLRTQISLPVKLLFASSEDIIDKWIPKLPTCEKIGETMPTTTHLNLNEHARLEIEDLSDLCMFCGAGPFLMDGVIIIRVADTDHQFEVTFPKLSRKARRQASSSESHALFVLPKYWSTIELDYSHHNGLCFGLRNRGTTDEYALFRRSFRWRRLRDDEPNTDTIVPSTSEISSQHRYDVIQYPGLQDSPATHHYKLLLDMGLQHARVLQWHRRAFYPFAESGRQVAVTVDHLDFFLRIQRVVLGLKFVFWTGGLVSGMPGFSRSNLPKFVFADLFIIFMFWFMGYVSAIERQFLSSHCRDQLQKLWALSLTRSSYKGLFRTSIDFGKSQGFRLLGCNYMLVTLTATAFIPTYFNFCRAWFPMPGQATVFDVLVAPVIAIVFPAWFLMADGDRRTYNSLGYIGCILDATSSLFIVFYISVIVRMVFWLRHIFLKSSAIRLQDRDEEMGNARAHSTHIRSQSRSRFGSTRPTRAQILTLLLTTYALAIVVTGVYEEQKESGWINALLSASLMIIGVPLLVWLLHFGHTYLPGGMAALAISLEPLGQGQGQNQDPGDPDNILPSSSM